MKKLEIGTYRFSENNGEIHVRFKDMTEISLAGLAIEVIGIRKEHPEMWSVSLVTDIAIKKLRAQTEDTLQLITFDFDTFQEAITCQSFLALKLYQTQPSIKE